MERKWNPSKPAWAQLANQEFLITQTQMGKSE